MSDYLNVKKHGAVGDGVTDDTASIQSAIDTAAQTGETVYFPAGRFVCGELIVRRNIYLKADHTWGYRGESAGRSVLIQRDDEQDCILNVTGANGSTMDGLSLLGRGGRDGHCAGILSKKTDYGTEEDAYRIENCRVARFASHAVYLDRVWCFSVRHCMFAYCGGDGLCITGWDGFVIDNWFSGNRGAGWSGNHGANASVTMTGNRIEWNAGGGIVIRGGNHYNITGNYIDRAGTSGIIIENSHSIACTGNVVYRSGKYEANLPASAQCIIKSSSGVSFTGNTFSAGKDDGGQGTVTPNYSLILDNLTNCTITSNTMHQGSTTSPIIDKQNHTNSIIKDNVGSAVNQW